MNRKISLAGTVALAVMVFIFFLCQLISVFYRTPLLAWISYGVCIFLSWAYVITTIGHARLCSADKSVAAETAKLFAVIYAVFICLVYFTQLTVVRQNVLDSAVVNAFSFDYPGSWLFGIDIIGYGIMAFSTFFLGLSVEPENKADKVLKTMSMLHGIFVVCIFMPMTSLFTSGFEGDSAAGMGALMLAVWCVIFFPIAFCSYLRFKRTADF